MVDLFDSVVVSGDHTEGVRSRWILHTISRPIVIVVRGSQMKGGRSRGLLWTIPSPMSGGLVIAKGTLEGPAIIGCMGRLPAKSATVSFC